MKFREYRPTCIIRRHFLKKPGLGLAFFSADNTLYREGILFRLVAVKISRPPVPPPPPPPPLVSYPDPNVRKHYRLQYNTAYIVSIYHNLSRARTIKHQAPLCSVECYWNLIIVTSRELSILIGAPTFRRTRTTSIDLLARPSVRDVIL